MEKKLLYVFVVSLINYASWSQDSVKHISLQEAITATAFNNTGIKLSGLDVLVAKTQFRMTDAFCLPQANISYTASATNDPLNAFGFKLQQKSITAVDFDPKMLNNPAPVQSYSAKIELQQPLLNFDMRYKRNAAAKQVEMYQLLSDRVKEYLRYETEKAYLQLQIAYEEHKVLAEALVTSEAVYKISKDYYDQGLIPKSDLLSAELHVVSIQTQVQRSHSAIRDASDMLSLLMNQAPGTVYSVDSIVISHAVVAESKDLFDERSDFKALQKGVESSDMMIKSAKTSYLPRVNAFASYQLYDKHLLGFHAHAYIAGVRFSWNILNGNQIKNAVSQQYLEKEKLSVKLDQQKSEALLRIGQARRQLKDASFFIKQQHKAVEQAAEAFRVLKNRYTQGLEKTTDVLMAHTLLSQQKAGYVQAVFQYNLAIASLQFLTSSK